MHNRVQMGKENLAAIAEALINHGRDATYEECSETMQKRLGRTISSPVFYKRRKEFKNHSVPALAKLAGINPSLPQPATAQATKRVASTQESSLPSTFTSLDLELTLELDRMATRVGVQKLVEIMAVVQSRHALDRT